MVKAQRGGVAHLCTSDAMALGDFLWFSTPFRCSYKMKKISKLCNMDVYVMFLYQNHDFQEKLFTRIIMVN